MSQASLDEPAGGAQRVLVVDDAEDMRTLVSFVLAGSPRYEFVGEAADGQAAIDRTRELQPDLVILDLSMPGMDGLEALPHLLELDTRVIVLSGYAKDAMAAKAIELGALGYVEKGERPDALLAHLDELTGADQERAPIRPPAVLGRAGAPTSFNALAAQLEELRGMLGPFLDDMAAPPQELTGVSGALAQLAKEVRDLSTLSTHQEPVTSIERVDLRQAVDEGLADLPASDRERIRISGEPAPCRASRGGAQRIATEFVTNALRHGEGPVEVVLSGRRLLVTDQGPGITIDPPENCFLPFVTGERDGTRTGLGLTVVAEIARIWGINVWIEHDEGNHPTFAAEFPGA